MSNNNNENNNNAMTMVPTIIMRSIPQAVNHLNTYNKVCFE